MRKYIAEFLGTLLLVLMGTTAATVLLQAAGPLAVAVAFGAAVIAGIAMFGHISGAHFNPAVSLGAAIVGRITWGEFAGYVVAQVIGALAGTGILFGMLRGMGLKTTQLSQVGLGQTVYNAPMNFFTAALVELVLTFFFVLTILMATSKKNEAGNKMAPFAIGITLGALILIGLQFTGGSLNPARSLAPAVGMALSGSSTALTDFAAYLVGPLLGAALAAVVAKFGLGSEEA